MSMTRDKLEKLIQEAKDKLAAKEAAKQPLPPVLPVSQTPQQIVEQATSDSPIAAPFEWNPEQTKAFSLGLEGASFNLIGAAGTGKTTCLKELARQLVTNGKTPPISFSTKYLAKGLPGIVFTSFTRRAVRNLKRVLSADLAAHCVTLHKLLEYEPMFYDVWDEEQQKNRTTMRFEPARNKLCKLPNTLVYVVVDESSMVSTELFAKLLEALPDFRNVRFIFVGDLHQLPPVYGSAILGFKLLELPTVELTRIYRQAQESPIIALAHKIKNGEVIPVTAKVTTETSQGKVTIHPWKKALSDFDATHTASLFLRKLVTEGDYNEEEDIILCPQEKTKNLSFGTNEFNRVVADALGKKKKAEVVEIIAGYVRHYFAAGDRLLVGREDAIITKITKNAKYWGKRPRPASLHLDRWGNYAVKVEEEVDGEGEMDVDKYLEQFSLDSGKEGDDEDRKQESSHIIDIELLDSGAKETLSSAGEINAAQFAYCLTVHKSQGSEWNRVFFLTHQSHVVMWNRELLYTAVTRARKELYCIVEPDRGSKSGTFTKAAMSPRIKGDTLAEKAEYFKGKAEEWDKRMEEVSRLPKGQGQIVEKKYEGDTYVEKIVPVIPVQQKPVELIKLCNFVSKEFKEAAQKRMENDWSRATMIWGERIGTMPQLRYDLQSETKIGLASYGKNSIFLNSLWCIAAERDPRIWTEMIDDTIPHEVAHFVAQRDSNSRGHDSGWIMAAKLLGMKNPSATTDEFPSWAKSLKFITEELKERLKNEKEIPGETQIDFSDNETGE